MVVNLQRAGILFDPHSVPGNHISGWLLDPWGIEWLHRQFKIRSKTSVVVKTGVPVSLFNILLFRRKATFDLDALYRDHGAMVARRISRFVKTDDVEEVLHEVFLKAFERRDSFRGDASPVTWLYNIATNHCLNRIRDRKRRQQSLAQNRDLPWLSPTTHAGVQHQILLEQLWDELNDNQAMIAVYYFIDGLTHSEIARITGVSRRTIGNRIEEITTQMKARAEKMI